MGYRSWGHKESDMTEYASVYIHAHTHTHTHTHTRLLSPKAEVSPTVSKMAA